MILRWAVSHWTFAMSFSIVKRWRACWYVWYATFLSPACFRQRSCSYFWLFLFHFGSILIFMIALIFSRNVTIFVSFEQRHLWSVLFIQYFKKMLYLADCTSGEKLVLYYCPPGHLISFGLEHFTCTLLVMWISNCLSRMFTLFCDSDSWSAKRRGNLSPSWIIWVSSFTIMSMSIWFS